MFLGSESYLFHRAIPFSKCPLHCSLHQIHIHYNVVVLNFVQNFLQRQVIDEFDQNVHFVEIDIEEDPEIAEAAGIMGTPCVQFFKNKEMIK